MKYLTAEQVLFIHARLIAETGDEHGVLDLGLLQSAVARPQVFLTGRIFILGYSRKRLLCWKA